MGQNLNSLKGVTYRIILGTTRSSDYSSNGVQLPVALGFWDLGVMGPDPWLAFDRGPIAILLQLQRSGGAAGGPYASGTQRMGCL